MNLDSVCPHAERSHTVLSREGVPQVLGLVGSGETVSMRVSPMLTGAPNKVRGRSANPEYRVMEGRQAISRCDPGRECVVYWYSI